MKIRVLGKHQPSRPAPVASWFYHAEVYDDSEPSKAMWSCEHHHESPQLAHGCAANWMEDSQGRAPLTERTA